MLMAFLLHSDTTVEFFKLVVMMYLLSLFFSALLTKLYMYLADTWLYSKLKKIKEEIIPLEKNSKTAFFFLHPIINASFLPIVVFLALIKELWLYYDHFTLSTILIAGFLFETVISIIPVLNHYGKAYGITSENLYIVHMDKIVPIKLSEIKNYYLKKTSNLSFLRITTDNNRKYLYFVDNLDEAVHIIDKKEIENG